MTISVLYGPLCVFQDGSWSYGGLPSCPDYADCEVWRIEALSGERAIKKGSTVAISATPSLLLRGTYATKHRQPLRTPRITHQRHNEARTSGQRMSNSDGAQRSGGRGRRFESCRVRDFRYLLPLFAFTAAALGAFGVILAWIFWVMQHALVFHV